MTVRPVCAECGSKANPVKHYRLDPTNLKSAYRLLCLPCGKKLRFTRVDWQRPAMSNTKLAERGRHRSDS